MKYETPNAELLLFVTDDILALSDENETGKQPLGHNRDRDRDRDDERERE